MNIIIIGFLGVGKTTVGRLLAQKINYGFIDTDYEIEKISGMKVGKIFKQNGEDYFRRQESIIVNNVYNLNNVVISTGGGVVLNYENIQKLKTNGFIICLKASPATILRNISIQDERPVLQGKVTLDNIINLMNKRKNLYNNSDLEINVDLLSPDEIANIIIDKLKEKNIYGC